VLSGNDFEASLVGFALVGVISPPVTFRVSYCVTPRYKGRSSFKVIESKFPHHVEMLVPEGGFGSRLKRNARLARCPRYRGRARLEPPRERTRHYLVVLR
jgi:hypothetical protein